MILWVKVKVYKCAGMLIYNLESLEFFSCVNCVYSVKVVKVRCTHVLVW